jgi:hypothetical protein
MMPIPMRVILFLVLAPAWGLIAEFAMGLVGNRLHGQDVPRGAAGFSM